MPPLLALLAQAANPPGGGTSPLTTVLIALLAGGVGVAVVNWLRERRKDLATAGQIEAQRKSIVEDVNEVIWKRTQGELQRADRELEQERQARRQVQQKADVLEAMIETLRDRIAQMEADAAQEKSAAYAALLEAIPDAVIQAGQYGLIKAVNEAAMKLFGYDDRDEMLGQPLTSLMPARYRPPHRAGYAEALLTGTGPLLESESPTRVTACHADGHEFQVALRLSKQGQCFTALIHPYLSRYDDGLPLLDFPAS